MSNLEDLSLVKKINIDKRHIDNYVLETTEGTKRTKEKFYREASEQRNVYVRNQLTIFQQALTAIKNEMSKRYNNLMPVDHTEEYAKDLLKIDRYLDLVKLNSNMSCFFKLDLDFIVSSITDNTSLEELNQILGRFVKKMQEVGIALSYHDFNYSMFTEYYMKSYFEHSSSEELKKSFDSIYFACPDIKLQLKMNLEYLLKSNEKELEKYVDNYRLEKFKEYDVTSDNVIDKYVQIREEIGNRIAQDEYYNTIVFLEGKRKISDFEVEAPARAKNYDLFAVNGSYSELSEEEKKNYNEATMNLYLTLNELKKYYRYEFMIKDLVERYKDKDSIKNTYSSKVKEIDKEEKTRLGFYKEYLKATGVGFLAKRNEEKIQNAKLKMNEQIRKLHGLYDELRDLEITYKLSSVRESASIYDLFLVILQAFPFLEKSFTNQEEFQEKSLQDNVEDFFRFLYNPNNKFLRKINVFAEYNITEVVAEKYRLLGLKLAATDISLDTIDATLESVRFINLVQNVERSGIDFHKISNLCAMKALLDVDKQS
jgi:hypothetical protein